MAEKLLSNPNKKASHGRGGVGSSPSPFCLSKLPFFPPHSQTPPRYSPFDVKHTGNIGPTVNDAKHNLTTPTIKSSVYTTGRGGSGNMKKNDPKHPEVARKSQDVSPMPRRLSDEGIVHTGRGGAANVLRPSIEETMHSADENAVIEEGMQYNRQRKEGSGSNGAEGDWWRDDMAEDRTGR
ncbi:MAG: hypothetical protein Q9201_004644 [Fulgogasparrea decipioides]